MINKNIVTKFAALSLAVALSLGFAGNVFADQFIQQYRGDRGMWIQALNGRWWYQLDDGRWVADAWLKDNGEWYYFETDGYMAAGRWIQYGAKGWFYVDKSGKMLRNTTTPDGYYVDDVGAWVDPAKERK